MPDPMAGDFVANPTTGERGRVLRSSEESGGAEVVMEGIFDPHAAGPIRHRHPEQEERFEVLSGTLEFRVGREVTRLAAGGTLVVPPRVPHRFRNPGNEEARFIVTFRPGLRSDEMFVAGSRLLERVGPGRGHLPVALQRRILGRPYRDAGLPPLLYAARIGWRFRREISIGGGPLPLARIFTAVLAGVGRVAGRRIDP